MTHHQLRMHQFVLMSLFASDVLAGVALRVERPARREEAVRIERINSGSGVSLIVENHAMFDVTVALAVRVSNARVVRIRPETDTYPSGSRSQAVRILPNEPGRPFTWRLRLHWVKGNIRAKHDENAIYLLPFEAGRSFPVSQGHNGKLTHFDQDRYAVDFAMLEGTVVCAARSGVVVDVEQSFQRGGPSKKYKDQVNFVSIVHEDGTIGEYLHLWHNGVLVEIGQQVEAGHPIALSGNTGYSTLPHLHFGVYSPINARKLQSHRVTFATRQGLVTEPIQGRLYTAISPAK